MSDIDKQVQDILDNYGYFLGLGYTDKKGNLKVHKKGAVKKQLVALIQEQVRLARISELKQLEPPEQYEEYARIAGTDACYICGFNAVLFRKVIANRIKELKNE